MTLQEIRKSETLTLGEKKVYFYDRMLILTANKRGMTRYDELLYFYYYWRLKVYGFASGESGVKSYSDAQYIMRKISKHYMRLSRTDI